MCRWTYRSFTQNYQVNDLEIRWRQMLKEEYALTSCEKMRNKWAKHGQCCIEAQNLKDKPWRSELKTQQKICRL